MFQLGLGLAVYGIQLQTFVCTIPTQNSTINLHCKTAIYSPHTTDLGKGSDAILLLYHKVEYTMYLRT